MKLISLIICVLIKLILNQILCELIFEDDFNYLDSQKWHFVGEKGKCTESAHKQICIVDFYTSTRSSCYTMCITNNEANLRTTDGKLALSAKYGTYFESDTTTAFIESRFPLKLTKEKRLLFKIRMAFPLYSEIVPLFYLKLSSPYNYYDPVFYFNKNLNFGMNNDWNKSQAFISNLPKYILYDEFQIYELIIDHDKSSWRINGNEVYRREREWFRKIYSGNDLIFGFSVLVQSNSKAIRKNMPEQTKPCLTFLIDYIKLFKFNQTKSYQADLNDTEKAVDICKNVMELKKTSYIKFKPSTNYSLIFFDDFDGESLDQSKWTMMLDNVYCSRKNQICDESDYKRNIKVSEGSLKISVQKEEFKSPRANYTVIAAKTCFKNGLIVIRAKMTFLPYTATDQITYMYVTKFILKSYDGLCRIVRLNETGSIDIVEKYSWANDYSTGIYSRDKIIDLNENIDLNKLGKTNLSEFNEYGIEFSENLIQWFINDRVVNQVNRFFDATGNRQLVNFKESSYLPFDKQGHLFISVELNNWLPKTKIIGFKQSMVEIDYVKIYGEQFEYTEQTNEQAKTNDQLLKFWFPFSIGIILVILTVLVILIVMFWRKLKEKSEQAQINEFYDDIDLNKDKIDQIELDQGNVYEVIHDDYEVIPDNYEVVHEYINVDNDQAQNNTYLEITF